MRDSLRQRRALKLYSIFPLCALQLFAQSQPPTSEEDTLWDALTKTPAELASPIATQDNTIPRQRMGPVPGFTLAAPPRAQANTNDIFVHRKPKQKRFLGDIGDWLYQTQKSTGTKVDVKGQSLFSMRLDSISGNASAFESDRYLGRGSNGFYNDTSVDIDATLFKHFHYKTLLNNNILNNANDPNYNRTVMGYRTGKVNIDFGDINAGFQGNGLIDFNRFLNGVQYSQEWSRSFKTQLLYATTRAETRTITINGNGSVGPYYVYAGQIVDGSARVRVNDVDKILGKDYTLDQYTGELRFMNGQVILPSDTVAVTFETIGFNQSVGNIYGLRTEFRPSSKYGFGMTTVTQSSRTNNALQTRTQQFFGFGTPGAAYILDAPIDTTRPIAVLIGGLPLQKNIDYIIDPNLTNQIRILSPVPASTIIQVTYTPLNTSPTPGNRNVTGFDGTFSLGSLGTIRTDAAFSGLDVQGSNYSGSAWQIRTDLNLIRPKTTQETEGKSKHQPTWRVGLGYRSISPTFSSIQTPGFNRNEQAADFLTDYQPSRQWRLNFSTQKSKRPSYVSSGVNGAFSILTNGNDDYDQYSSSLVHEYRKGTISLNKNNLTTRFKTGGNSINDSDSLAANYNTGKVTVDLSLNNNKSNTNALLTSGTTPTSVFSNNSSTGGRLGVSWQTNDWLTLSAALTNSAITTLSGTNFSQYTARDSQIQARLNLKNHMRLNYSFNLSDTGNSGTNTTGTGGGSNSGGGGVVLPPSRQTGGTSNTGFTSDSSGSTFGGGTNYNLGGYGSYSGYLGNSVNNGYGASSFGGKSVGHRVGIEYQYRKINIGLNMDMAESTGAYVFNSTRSNAAFTFGWQPSETMRFDTTLGLQRIDYSGSIGGSRGNTFSLGFSGRPFGRKLNISVDWLTVLNSSQIQYSALTGTTGGTPQAPSDTSTNLSSFRGRIEYPVARRWTLFTDFLQANTTGYLGGKELNLRIGADYALNQVLRFSLGWQTYSRNNADAQNATYNYHVSTILAELGFNFR